MADACTICGSAATAPFLSRTATPVLQNAVYADAESARAAARGDLDFRRCRACGFIWNAAFSSERLTYAPGYENRQSLSPAFQAHLAARAQAATGLIAGRANAVVVEVGCGQGDFLSFLREAMPPDNAPSLYGFDPAWRGADGSGPAGARVFRRLFDPSEALDGGRADLELGSRRPGSAAAGQPDTAFHSRLIAIEPLRLALPREHRLAAQPRVRLADVATDLFIGLRPVSALRKRTDDLCDQAGFRPTVIFEGDDLSNVRGFVAAGLGVAVVPAPRAGSPESAAGPVVYAEIGDPGAVREIFLIWSSERRLLPAADLFRRHVLRRAAAGRLPAVAP